MRLSLLLLQLLMLPLRMQLMPVLVLKCHSFVRLLWLLVFGFLDFDFVVCLFVVFAASTFMMMLLKNQKELVSKKKKKIQLRSP